MQKLIELDRHLREHKQSEGRKTYGRFLAKLSIIFFLYFLVCALIYLKSTETIVIAISGIVAGTFLGIYLFTILLLKTLPHDDKSEPEKYLEMVLKDLRVSTVSVNSSSVVKIAEELLETKRDTFLKAFVENLRREEHFGGTFSWPTNTEAFSERHTRDIVSPDPRATLDKVCEVLEQTNKKVGLDVPYSFTLSTTKQMNESGKKTAGTLEIDIIGFKITVIVTG